MSAAPLGPADFSDAEAWNAHVRAVAREKMARMSAAEVAQMRREMVKTAAADEIKALDQRQITQATARHSQKESAK